jgi:RNA polymerase sigma-70 factor (ECF subfamily)
VRKNWLARIQANTVTRGARGAVLGRWFRSRPVVPDAAFQDAGEPYPGHWRHSTEPWPGVTREQVLTALDELPDTWRAVLLRRDGAVPARGGGDAAVAAELGLTADQERDILTRARAALRDGVDRAHRTGPR